MYIGTLEFFFVSRQNPFQTEISRHIDNDGVMKVKLNTYSFQQIHIARQCFFKIGYSVLTKKIEIRSTFRCYIYVYI
jgi:hypothetical protein